MTRYLVVWLALLLFGGTTAWAEDNPIIRQVNALVEAFNSGDGAAVGRFYAEDGALLVPQAGIVVGPDAIGTHYQAAFDAGVGGLEYSVLEIRQLGPEAALEIGQTRIRVGDQTIANRSMHVWVVVDGTWLLSRDMYHVLGTVQ